MPHADITLTVACHPRTLRSQLCVYAYLFCVFPHRYLRERETACSLMKYWRLLVMPARGDRISEEKRCNLFGNCKGRSGQIEPVFFLI